MIKDKQELSVKIQQYKLERIADELIALAKPSIFMLSAAVDDASIAVGSSKFGGDPDLPP